jgi:hypothetical protein
VLIHYIRACFWVYSVCTRCEIERFSLNVSLVADVHALCSGRYSKVMLCSVTLDINAASAIALRILSMCQYTPHITLRTYIGMVYA